MSPEISDEKVRRLLADRDQRIQRACFIAREFGMCDGAHHKQWVIDQMLRALMASDYDDMMSEVVWDRGVAP